MKGESRPEDVKGFYDPLMKWLDQYHGGLRNERVEKPDVLMVELFMDYFNSSSAKYLIEIVAKLVAIHRQEDVPMKINWIYLEEDEDIKEAGEEISDMLDYPFQFTEVPEE
jgi:hypothetical protein